MSSTQEKLRRAMMTGPNRWAEATINGKLVSYYEIHDETILLDLIDSAKREELEHAKSINPYPLSVFPEPTNEEWELLDSLWYEETGNHIDRFSASLCRNGRQQVISEITAQLEQSEESI